MRVLQRIHRDYQQTLDVPSLAEIASMSVPAFHVHFKAMTSRSPLQYLKAIRLHQARLLMIRNDMSAISAAQHVGYESPSQFSREYTRLFGAPPKRDVNGLRRRADGGERSLDSASV